ncbi:hypothetical protein HNP86_001707 [Methanococcus maripaludis]|uniref:Uncharacterized protein n=1 Tax=Methanococcus maripaludis TaxID=39152 RepID=A0A7J9NWB7_METMI|nr:hypothetical protein [Methanococcus maripaludis]MBA2851554.1 hypothetical protein [Methanococcus maripaludis]
MYSRKRVLGQHITGTLKKVDLPTENILDKIFLMVKCNLTAASAKSVTVEEIGNIFKSFNVLSNNSTVHYSLGMNDILTMNYLDYKGKVKRIDDTIALTTTAKEFKALLILDAGDIVSFTKEALDLSVDYNLTAITDVTVSDIDITVTLDENVIESTAEAIALYGKGLDVIVEPKVSAIETTLSAGTAFDEVQSLPQGNILKRAICIFKDTSNARSNAINELVGIKDTVYYVEYYKQAFESMQLLDGAEYELENGALTGVVAIDFDKEITNEELGLKEFNYKKDQLQIATQNASNGKLRVIRHEYTLTSAAKAMILKNQKVVVEATN